MRCPSANTTGMPCVDGLTATWAALTNFKSAFAAPCYGICCQSTLASTNTSNGKIATPKISNSLPVALELHYSMKCMTCALCLSVREISDGFKSVPCFHIKSGLSLAITRAQSNGFLGT